MKPDKLTPRAKKLLALFRANSDLPTLELAKKTSLSVQSVYRWRSRLRPYLTADESPFVEMKLPTPKAKRSNSSESLQIFA